MLVLSVAVLIVAAVAWAATRADGRTGTETSTNDGGAWLLKRDHGAIGHLNREVLEVTAGVRVADAGADFDVDQAPGIIAVHDRSSSRLILVDGRTHQSRGELLVPDDIHVRAVTGGIVAYTPSPLKVWILTADEALAAADLTDIDPTLLSTNAGLVSVDGVSPVALDTTTGEFLHPTGQKTGIAPALAAEINNISTVGEAIVAATDNGLVIVGADQQPPPNENAPGATYILQQPAAEAAPTAIALLNHDLLELDLSTGVVTNLATLAGDNHLAPIAHQGCVFAVAAEPPTFSKHCDGSLVEESPLAGAGSELRLRLVNGWVWINDIETGGAWMTNPDAPLSRIDDWGAALADQQEQESEATTEDGGGIEEVRINPDNASAELIDADEQDEDDENEPPIARDDEGQTRVDRPVVLRVLDNDEDADGDVLLVTDVEVLDNSNAQVWLTATGDAIQISPAAGFTGTIQLSYAISDGRGGSARALGTIEVSPGSQASNRPPETVTDVATARAGALVSLNVLANDHDPDGDSLVLLDASGPGGILVFDPSGQITFTPDTTGNQAQIELAYEVADDFGATATGRVIVNVRLEDANSSPDARNDAAVTSVGNPARLNALDNDTDPDGDALIAARQPVLLRGPSTQNTAAQLTADGEFFFLPTAPGDYVFEYVISDGQNTDAAQIRVSVTDAEANEPPVAIRDDVTIPVGASRLVYALDNDGDPNGDVVGIVEWSGAAGLIVEEVPGLGFRVTVEPDAADRVVFRYAISDGINEPVATVVVVSVVDIEPVNQPPVLKADTIELRAGRTTVVSVLTNDYDPEGGSLQVIRAVEQLGIDATIEVGPDGQSVIITLGPDVTDSFSFGYDVQDEDGASSAAVVDVRVVNPGEPNRPPIARPDTGRTSDGLTVSVDVIGNDSDPDGDAIQIESIATQPAFGSAEISLDADVGVINYRPVEGFAGTDRFEYVLIDTEGARSVGVVQIGVTPTAIENRPPSANNDLFITAAGSEAVVLDVLANDYDPDNDTLTIVEATSPEVGTVSINGDHVIFVPPAALQTDVPLELSFLYEITDGAGNADDARVRIVVNPLPDPEPPVAIDDQVGPIRGNRRVTVDVRANDLDPDGDPAELTVTSVDPAVTVASGAGGNASSGAGLLHIEVGIESSQHRYTITDPDGLTATGTVTVFVVDNEAPTVNSTRVETEHETPISLSLDSAATDPDGDALFFACCDDSTGGVARIERSGEGELQVSFEPSPGFTGTGGFSYSVDDQAGHLVAARVEVVVLPPDNVAPSATDTTIDVEAGTTVPFDLSGLVADPDVGDSLEFALTSNQPENGSGVTLSGSALTISAPLDRADTQLTVGYEVRDAGGLTAQGNVTVNITPVSAPPPVAVADSASTNQGMAVEFNILANDIDPLGQGLDVFQMGTTQAGSIAEPAPGTVLFTPDPAFFGTTTFTYTLRDATQSPDRETVGQVTVDVVGRPAIPAPPGANADNAVAAVTWSTPLDNGAAVDGYRIEYRSVGGDSGSVDVDVQNSFTATGLINGDEYQFRLQAHNIAGWGEWSGWSAPVRPDTRPNAPGPPVVTFGDGELDVSWLAPSNQGSALTGYKIEIGGGDNQVITVGTNPTHDWRGLSNGVEYQFRVAAVNAAGDSDWSGWSASDHPLGSPFAPTTPTADRGNRYLDIGWQAPGTNGDAIINYEIEIRATGQVISVAGAGTTSYRWADLTNGVAQEFRVRASNRAPAPGPWSPWSTPVTPCSVPDQPATPGAVRGDQQVSVSWSPPDDQGCAITSYNIRANGSTVQTAGAGATNLSFTGLTNGQSYSFEVQAVNEEGSSAWSAASASVTPAGPPTAPSISSSQATAPGTISLQFGGANANGSAVTHHQVSINSGNPTTVSGSSYVASGLAENTSYGFRVRACNDVGCSAWSATQNATTWGPPSAPLAVNASAGNATWQFSWSTPADNGGSGITAYEYRINGGTPSTTPATTNQVNLSGQPNGTTITGEVRGCNAVGCGPWASASATPTAPPPTVSISVGGPYSGATNCIGCNWVQVNGSNFTPNSTVQVICYSSNGGQFASNARTVSANGTLSTAPCFFGYSGQTVWVTVAGTASNTITWP